MNDQKKIICKVMFDTNIYDQIEKDSDLYEKIFSLIRENKIKIITTHIQEDELKNKKYKIDIAEDKLPTEGFLLGISRLGEAKLGDGKGNKSKIFKEEKVHTAGGVYGISRYGESAYGDGNQSGISISDVKTEHGNRLEDALIATTASLNADILVTEDKKLLRRLKKIPIQCEVLSFNEFKQRLLSWKI